MDATITPPELARELGHDDGGHKIRKFLRHPWDGDGPFANHLHRAHWHLAPQEADRVRRAFKKLDGGP